MHKSHGIFGGDMTDTRKIRQSVVLLIDDEPARSAEHRRVIEAVGCMCHSVSTLAEAEHILTHYAPDCVVMVTGEISEVELERAVMQGIYAYLARPFADADLQRLVQAAITDYHTARIARK
jgi:CheY-like chemotaxis protein